MRNQGLLLFVPAGAAPYGVPMQHPAGHSCPESAGSADCAHRTELERLATLDAATIARALDDRRALYPLISGAVDQYLDLDDRADAAFAAGNSDEAMYLHQEASAWRATVTVLKQIEQHGHGAAAPMTGIA